MGNHRYMKVSRCREPEQSLQPNLARRGIHDIDAADYLGYTLDRVIDDDGQLIGNQAIAAPNYKVTRFTFQPLRNLSLQAINEPNGIVVGAQTDSKFLGITAAATRSRINNAERTARRIGEIFA